MDQNLPKLYKDYGLYSNYRNFPLDLDGLKPVERRALLSAYKIARNKFAKSRQVDSYTTGHYHPHGECYGTIVQLVKQGFLIGQGNFGSNVGVDVTGPAASRYTECQLHPRTVDLAFKYINHVPWQQTELNDTEPVFLPAMFPLCLMGTEYTQGIGFGFKTYIPCYKVEDLYKRLLWLLGLSKQKPTIKPISDCHIVADNKQLETLLTTGSAKIDVNGVIHVNNKANVATLKSWPPGKRFESFLKKFEKELADGVIGFTDLSVGTTEIVFQVLRERNRDKIFEDFIGKLQEAVQGSVSFELVVVDQNQKVSTKSVDNMLLDTYKMFTSVNEQMLNHEIKKIDESIAEYKILEQIKPFLSKELLSKTDANTIMNSIAKQSSVPFEKIRELFGKYRITKLLTVNTDTTELNNQKKTLLECLSGIDKFVLEQYNIF